MRLRAEKLRRGRAVGVSLPPIERRRAMSHGRRRPRGFPGAIAVAIVAVMCRPLTAPVVGVSAGWRTANSATPHLRSSPVENVLRGLVLSAAPSFAVALGSARVGETCSSDDDCYDGYGCGGVCCGYNVGKKGTNCATCEPASMAMYVTCSSCDEGYSLAFNVDSPSYKYCREDCGANQYRTSSSSDECYDLQDAGAECSGDFSCASGKCGEKYCCDEAEMNSVFEETNECCDLCSDTGACLTTSPAMCSSSSCDASSEPENGDIGDCTGSLDPGSSCTPKCNDGYVLTGT